MMKNIDAKKKEQTKGEDIESVANRLISSLGPNLRGLGHRSSCST